MELVRKDHYSTFCKHFHVCDLALDTDFLQEIQVHYDMNFGLEMFIEKLQMLAYMCVSLEQKVVWFK